MTPVTVRFMTLSGPIKTVKTEHFASESDALVAVKAYAEAQGFANVKSVPDADDPYAGGFRFTARTPGGRSGRNVAFGDWDE